MSPLFLRCGPFDTTRTVACLGTLHRVANRRHAAALHRTTQFTDSQLSLVANVKQFCKAYPYPPMRNVVLSCVHCLAIGREGSIPSQPRAFESRRFSRAFRRPNSTRRSV